MLRAARSLCSRRIRPPVQSTGSERRSCSNQARVSSPAAVFGAPSAAANCASVHRPTDDSNLMPRQSIFDPDHIEVTQHGSMTVARDTGPSLPFRGPRVGQQPTNSNEAEQRRRHLENDLALREAMDGQAPESFDMTAGPHSGRGRNEMPGKSTDDLRADLYRQSGASEEDIRWDRFNRGR